MRFHQRLAVTVVCCLIASTCLAVRADETKPAGNGKSAPLFDGKSTDGWKQCGPGKFNVVDGVLVSEGGMGMLWYAGKEFGDFTLNLQYKVEDKSDNAGVFVRFPDPGNDPLVAVNKGHEIQIQEGDGGKNTTGAVYNFKNADAQNAKPPGEWNDYEIKVIGNVYTIRINGKQVNEFTSPDRPLKGYIGLQNHDPKSVVRFRNISITEISSGASPASEEAAKTQAADKPGLVGQYFIATREQNPFDGKTVPFLVRVDPQVNFKMTDGQFYQAKLDDNFSVKWDGFLKIDQPGDYKFILRSDDDSQLFIDDKIVVDNTGVNATTVMKDKNGAVNLKAGNHAIRLQFREYGGGAGMVLSHIPPDGKRKIVPAAMLFHTDAQLAGVKWDKEAFAKTEYKGKPSSSDGAAAMDYGPFITHTVVAGEGNIALKGVALKVGENAEAAILFDPELLRHAAGWTGGFLNLTGVVFDGAHGVNPTPAGDIIFAAKDQPGVTPGAPSADTAKDPRAVPFGPMPKERGAYKGMYRNGKQVVFAYTVGTRLVRELPGFANVQGTPVFTRTIEIAAGDQPVTLLAYDANAESGVMFVAEKDVESQEIEGHRYFIFPPAQLTRTYKVAIVAKPAEGDVPLEAAMNLIGKKEDVAALCTGGPSNYAQAIETKGALGTSDGGAYVVDTLTVPFENPWNSWLRFGGVDFFSDGSAALCTWSGDVWTVKGIDDKLEKLTWRRAATGMFQTLGLRIVDDQLYVLGRDGITRLHDLNKDGEYDYYEAFNHDVMVSQSFHEFAFDLQTDPQGNFYFAKAGPVRPGGRGWETLTPHNGTVLRVSKDGSKLDVFATGVRAPNGMGAGPEGQITVGDNEGTWTPTCRLSFVEEGDFLGVVEMSKQPTPPATYSPALVWLSHRETDNSSGGQVWVTSDQWGSFQGDMLHTSYGMCTLFKVMKEKVDGVWQGGVVRFPLKFESGICRGRFHPIDKQLYLSGLRGWQTTAAKDGCFQRVRYTGKPAYLPTEMHVKEDGILVEFTSPLDRDSAIDVDNYAVEQWNYLWTSDYGSPEVSVEDTTLQERDPVEVDSVELMPDGKSIFIRITDLKPVMSMKIQYKIKAADGTAMDSAIFNTINKLGKGDGNAVSNAEAGQ